MSIADIAIGAFLGGFFGYGFARWGLYRRTRKLARQGRIPCRLRVVSGPDDGTSRRWSPGVATLAPGQITFVGSRSPGPLVIQVDSIDPARQRRPRTSELLRFDRDFRIIGVTTPTAVLEWAVLSDQLAWAVAQLTRPRSDAR